MIEQSRSLEQVDIKAEKLIDADSARRSIQTATHKLAVGDFAEAIKNLSATQLSLSELRSQPNIISAAKEGIDASLEKGDRDSAGRIFTVFGLSAQEFPGLSRAGAFLHSPVSEPIGGLAFSALELRDEFLKELSDPKSFKIQNCDGHDFYTKAFDHPKLRTQGALEVYTNPQYLEKVRSAGIELPMVNAIIRPPGLFRGFYMRVQVITEKFPIEDKDMRALRGELADTIYHELCHHGQETYRQNNPKESLPKIKYGHLDSKPGFATSLAYFVECPDEVSAFVRESGFRSSRLGISIGEGLRRTIDQQIRLSNVDAKFSATEESILRTCMRETYQQIASDLWPTKRISIPS